MDTTTLTVIAIMGMALGALAVAWWRERKRRKYYESAYKITSQHAAAMTDAAIEMAVMTDLVLDMADLFGDGVQS